MREHLKEKIRGFPEEVAREVPKTQNEISEFIKKGVEADEKERDAAIK